MFKKAPKSEPFERELVHECLVDFDFDEFYQLNEMKADKPYYVPDKKQLLKYSDDLYNENTPQFSAMSNFFANALKTDKKFAMDLVSEIMITITDCSGTFEDTINYLEWRKCHLKSTQLERFLELYTDLKNNTRMPCNNGYTPLELRELYNYSDTPHQITFGPNITNSLNSGDMQTYKMLMQTSDLNELSDKAKKQLSDFADKYITGQPKKGKVGRNDLCPCGSGKKYKKCCGR